MSGHLEDEIDRTIYETLQYFDQFSFPLSEAELLTFLGVRTSRKKLNHHLQRLLSKNKLTYDEKNQTYTLRGHSIYSKLRTTRKAQTQRKLIKIEKFVRVLSRFPFIKLIGVSGSCAMGNAQKSDDVDFFIISGKGRIWTSRLVAIVCAELFSQRRKRGSKEIRDTVCLNLFFDEHYLSVPNSKRNLYVAHEIVQMKPLYNSNGTYERFLEANAWVKTRFPNFELQKGVRKRNMSHKHTRTVGNMFESIVRLIQIYIMRPHQTSERISDKQLWFFPDDFEKKIRI